MGGIVGIKWNIYMETSCFCVFMLLNYMKAHVFSPFNAHFFPCDIIMVNGPLVQNVKLLFIHTSNINRNILLPVGKPTTLDEIKDKFCAAGDACQEDVDQQVYNAKCTETNCGRPKEASKLRHCIR